MLVDLGRNDVGKVSKSGSVNVEKLMNVERYSHVIHISSTVSGELLDHLTCWDALRAALPVGTVSGAPKVKAMELIDQLEVTRRGPYGGGFGGISFSGDMDIALALRAIVFPTGARYETMYSYKNANKRQEWVVHLQAGAGIVVDSVPDDEQRECENKAAGLALAIDLAESAGDKKTAKGKRFNHSFGNARPRDKKKGRGPPRVPVPPAPPKKDRFDDDQCTYNQIEVKVEDHDLWQKVLITIGQVSSATIKGTVGYVAPEYGMGGEVSTEGDVYSYGILLLEMITGKRPTDKMFKDGLSLHSFCKMTFPERVEELVDSCLLVEEINEVMTNRARNHTQLRGKRVECLLSIIQIGIACSVESPGERMDIQDVIRNLHQVKQVFLGV
ncbi:hypothetical protein F0562_026300 [Nyssa sinensis]|uniref:Protein kinase domain-containing protein n=1 Tax=Nyssa sinensis TaxID=561372 RepID=A0A5J5BAD7_9ASTE|nr:hypothetical protein F0562_026300 [Nyssa sinensis]